MENAGLSWGNKKTFLLYYIDFPAFFVYCVCLEVIQMTVLQDELLDDFITDLRERTLSEFRHHKKEIQDRYDMIRELSMKLQGILSQLSKENEQIIQDYIDEKDSLAGDELNYVYLKGMTDCCKLLKLLEII